MKNWDDTVIGEFIDKRCPKCGATLLGNRIGDEWCSFVYCDYGLETKSPKEQIRT